MPILMVDPEHATIACTPDLAERHRGHLAVAQSRLTELAGAECVVWPYRDVTPAAVRQFDPIALIIGGSSSDWSAYDFNEMAGLFDTIRETALPVLGICAGHQLIGRAFGAAWGPLTRSAAKDREPDPVFGSDKPAESGYLPVTIDADCPLFSGMHGSATVCQSHYWQLQEIPAGFAVRASSAACPMQAIEHVTRPVFGVQFHPERFDDCHPDGQQIILNFLTLARSPAR